MHRTSQSGAVGALLYVMFVALMVIPWHSSASTLSGPLAFVCLVLSGLLGIRAAHAETKWWYLLTAVAGVTVAAGIVLGLRAD